MVLMDYFDQVIDGIEFLLAFGSIMGLLGLLIGLIGLIWGHKKSKVAFLKVFIISAVILAFCGGYQRGIKYFRIH